jgi:hypothetical protein
VTFGDDKKGKVLGTGLIKVNNNFTSKDVALMDKLRYNLLSISQLVDADLGLKTKVDGLVIWASKSLRQFPGLGLKTKWEEVCRFMPQNQ